MFRAPEREAELLRWTINHCDGSNSPSSRIDFEEGWQMIEEYGLKVLRQMLAEFMINRLKSSSANAKIIKPFGSKGVSSLYTISFKMLTGTLSTASDPAYELYNR